MGSVISDSRIATDALLRLKRERAKDRRVPELLRGGPDAELCFLRMDCAAVWN